jgi:uridylate kinase
MANYGRIILKLSGETLANGGGCYDAKRVDAAADVIAKLSERGIQVGVVIGGGNIWRGRFTGAMNPVNADQMGMLATIINAICVEDALTAGAVRPARSPRSRWTASRSSTPPGRPTNT